MRASKEKNPEPRITEVHETLPLGPKRNIIIVGSGGREHALQWKAQASQYSIRVFVAPGNGGTANNLDFIKQTDFDLLVSFAKKNQCFAIIGPEIPLSLGVVDMLEEEKVPVFGPTREQASLESSKSFAKLLMAEMGIPTARFDSFSDLDRAISFASQFDGKVAVKVDGLAAGKGVIVCSNMEEAENAIRSILVDGAFGEAGTSIVVEEKLSGKEISLMSLCDGKNAIPLGTAVDYKRLRDGGIGPNTGGMGAYSPADNFDLETTKQLMKNVVQPIVSKLRYKGFLYTGLMLTNEGPKVLEFNARLGDPETQVILPRLDSDLVEILLAASGEIDLSILDIEPRWNSNFVCAVAMCASGYPDIPRVGDSITGLENIKQSPDTLVFHSGTKKVNGKIITNGGRVLYISSKGATLQEASERAYSSVKLVSWEGEYHRSDIGKQSASPQLVH